MRILLGTFLVLVAFTSASAQQVIVHSTDDGEVFSNGTVSDLGYLETSAGSLEGDIHFAAFDASADPSIELEINPYGEPLSGSQISVFGFDNATAMLQASDYGAGTLLGTWNVAGLGFGQETFFDVTPFVKSVKGPYFGFELQSNGLDLFSSTTHNYGTPPELIVTTPEPSSLMLALVGLSAAAMLFRPRRMGTNTEDH